MSLLPIIYTSLLIFTALFVIVLFVSYISYKAKTRNEIPVYLKHMDLSGSMAAVQPGVQNRNNTLKQYSNSVPRIITEHKTKIRTSPSNNNNARKSGSSYNVAVEVMRRKEEPVNEMEMARAKKNSRKSDYRKSTINDRLVIMNNTEKFRTTSGNEVYEERPRRHHTSHNELNVLTYYSDKPDMDFTVLATPHVRSVI